MPAKSLKEAGPCRNKPKNELTLSPEEQARQDADMKLLKLVEEGNVAEVKTMVDDQKQAVNVGDENGESSVHKCMRIRSPEAATQMLTMLIEAGAFADYADSYGKRPISVCMEQGESEASGLLMDALLGLVDSSGGRVVDLAATNHKTGNTHIHDACWVGNLAAIRALLATGAFNGALEATNKQGRASAKALVARARNRTRCASPRARLAATRGALVFFVLSPGVRFFPSPRDGDARRRVPLAQRGRASTERGARASPAHRRQQARSVTSTARPYLNIPSSLVVFMHAPPMHGTSPPGWSVCTPLRQAPHCNVCACSRMRRPVRMSTPLRSRLVASPRRHLKTWRWPWAGRTPPIT